MAVLLKEHRETTEETYDIYLLPPGEDPEACQSYLRMRNRDGKYSLIFEVRLISSTTWWFVVMTMILYFSKHF